MSSDVTDTTDLVIGSGPSGVAVATALLSRGRKVLMIDGGKELEAEAAEARTRIAGMDPRKWTDGDREAWQTGQFETPEGQVRRFGSDFAMETAEATLNHSEGFALRASRAVGGLSNLWGAAVLPNRAEDIADWPISWNDLEPHYRAVSEFMPIAGGADGLEALFPVLPMAEKKPLPPSPQGAVLLKRINKRRATLAKIGVHAGAARVAVDHACRNCGQCLHGCPWGYIYSAANTVAQLRKRPGFSYRSGPIARAITEGRGRVSVTLEGGDEIIANRVFVAAGVLETARLVLVSDMSRSGVLRLKDSQSFFLPTLHRWRNRIRPDRASSTTLAQAFVEIDAPRVSPHLLHAQLYTWNEFYARDLIANYGGKFPGAAPILKRLARRLIVAQVFLHSDHSAAIELTLATGSLIHPRVIQRAETGAVIAAAKRQVGKALGKVGLTALRFAARPGIAGSSFHVGGSVPMSADPRPGESDTLGRPKGLTRVHLVDASVLPSIPATTITFSVMANAHRIGMLAP